MLKIFKVSKEAHAAVQALVATEPFARNGYLYRECASLGLKGEGYYLYVEAPDAFFKDQEEALKIEGMEEIEGKDFEEVKEKIEAEQDNVATGLSLFD